MTSVTASLLVVVGVLAAAVIALLIERMRRTSAGLAQRRNEERFRLLVDGAPIMIWTARPDTMIDFLNRPVMEFTGLPIEVLLDHGWLNAVHPDDRDGCAAIFFPACEARRPFILEYRLRRADGAYRWMLDTGVPEYLPDGSYEGYLGCVVDITERKEAEDKIRASQAELAASHREIRHLAGRLIEAQDAERARVARELHDDVSQQIAGVSIAISNLKRRLGELSANEDVQVELRALHQNTSALADNVRQVSHDLHPTVLRHAGLVVALTSFCADLDRSHRTVLTCTAEGDLASLAPEVALCLYRIAQESLRNVIAHAAASRADVRLVRCGDDVDMAIEDNGQGFEVASARERGEGLGLVSIAERARLAGGCVDIESELGEGTRLRVRVPAQAQVASSDGVHGRGRRREARGGEASQEGSRGARTGGSLEPR